MTKAEAIAALAIEFPAFIPTIAFGHGVNGPYANIGLSKNGVDFTKFPEPEGRSSWQFRLAKPKAGTIPIPILAKAVAAGRAWVKLSTPAPE